MKWRHLVIDTRTNFFAFFETLSQGLLVLKCHLGSNKIVKIWGTLAAAPLDPAVTTPLSSIEFRVWKNEKITIQKYWTPFSVVIMFGAAVFPKAYFAESGLYILYFRSNNPEQ